MHQRHSVEAWSLSGALHGLFVVGAMLFMSTIKPVTEQPVFRWDVSLVNAPHHEVSPSLPEKQPVLPRQSRTSKEAKPHPVQRERRVVERISTQVLESSIAMPRSTIVQQQERVLTSPAQQTVSQIQQRQPVERQTVEASVTRERSIPQVPPRETPSRVMHEIQASVSAVVATESVPTEPQIESRAESRTIFEKEVVASRVISESSPTIHDIHPSASSVATTESVPVESRVESRAEQIPTSEKAVIASPVIAEPSRAAASQSSPTAKTDYGWLAASLAARLAEVKHYPATARLYGWQGKVLLRAVIRADGNLVEVTIRKTSGYPELDEAAKEALRLACPIPMRHELGRTEIAINVPVNFQLSE